jgi:adenine-specific DNA-methyltransferase
LPEPTPPDSEARQAGYENIAQITRERIRRAFARVEADTNGKLPPIKKAESYTAVNARHGFRAFWLTSSNFKIWNSEPITEGSLSITQQIEAFVNNLKPDRSQEDVLYEILLKSGHFLSLRPVLIELGGQEVFSVEGDRLLICLEGQVTKELFGKIVERKPQQVVCLDTSFDGNDQLKTNIVLEMRDHEIGFRTV